jgi:hypothetical protein
VLWFERQVVDQLTTTDDPVRRDEVAAFVEGALRSMPEHLRAAIAAASVFVGAGARVVGVRRLSVAALDASPIPQLRQYARMFRSLVLFAEQELPTSTRAMVAAG